MALKLFKLLFLFLIFAFPLSGQHNVVFSEPDYNVSFSIDWVRGELLTHISFNLSDAGIRLPGGRFLGEELLREAYPSLLRSSVFSIRYDSGSAIRDLYGRGSISLRELDNLSLMSERSSPNLSGDLRYMMESYTLSLESISSYFLPHRRAMEAPIPLIPVSTIAYSGIIIIANEALPVHGRLGSALVVPGLFPKIWDSNMNLVYDRNMFEAGLNNNYLMARYSAMNNILHPNPSGLEGDLATFLGPNPLYIFAHGTFGISPTDLIIDSDDALRILSSENNRQLLREGRVLIILDESVLY